MHAPDFVIRGHHIPRFVELQAELWTPPGLAQAMVTNYTHLKGYPETLEYAEDMIGYGRLSARRAKKSFTAVFNQFVGLQPTDTVSITTGAPDGICHSCVIGNHCSETGEQVALTAGGATYGAYESQLQDMYAVGKFTRIVRIAQEAGVLDPAIDTITPDTSGRLEPSANAIPVSESSYFSPNFAVNGQMMYQDPITVRAGLVRYVLGQWYTSD